MPLINYTNILLLPQQSRLNLACPAKNTVLKCCRNLRILKKLASLIASSSGLLGLSLCQVVLDCELEAKAFMFINANLGEVILRKVHQVVGANNILISQSYELLGEILAYSSPDAL